MSEWTASESLRFIPAAPLAAAIFHAVMLGVFRRGLSRWMVILTSCGAALISFGFTCEAFWELIGLTADRPVLTDRVYTWVGVGLSNASFTADLGFQFDALSAVMCLIVSGVGALIHLYAVGYMDADTREDGGFQRFFCYMNLFLASMLLLVLADNLLLLFVGWEAVGLCSYLLIGFWFSDRDNAYAGSKAFVVNRVGDFGFLVGMLLLFWSMAAAGEPGLGFRNLEAHFDAIAKASVTLPGWLGAGVWGLPSLVGLCFFVAACGKSAQGPLFVWLPDAMAGPTPVSALIHAATMVTAGVYLICRMSFLYAAAPEVSALMAWTGGVTALFAATIAIVQTDIKKLLAYSTVSQLGFMFLAAGCGAYAAAIFHVLTHAFFKSLLFMGAGAVILATSHVQDIDNMGALRSKLLRVHLVMGVGVAALSGVPLFSGFFSKEVILGSAYHTSVPGGTWLYGMALVSAGLTAFYAWRLFFLVFYGKNRLPRNIRTAQLDDPNDWIMVPLYGLAALAMFGGLFGLPQSWGDRWGVESSDSLGNFLAPVLVAPKPQLVEPGVESSLAIAASGMVLLGFSLAFQLYVRRPKTAAKLQQRFRGLHRLLEKKFYVDEIYDRLLVKPLLWFSDQVLFKLLDEGLIDGLIVNGSARVLRGFADGTLKHVHSGLAQTYLVFMIAGALAVVAYLLY